MKLCGNRSRISFDVKNEDMVFIQETYERFRPELIRDSWIRKGRIHTLGARAFMIYETIFHIARVKVFISIYQPLQVSKCEKCGKVIAELNIVDYG